MARAFRWTYDKVSHIGKKITSTAFAKYVSREESFRNAISLATSNCFDFESIQSKFEDQIDILFGDFLTEIPPSHKLHSIVDVFLHCVKNNDPEIKKKVQ